MTGFSARRRYREGGVRLGMAVKKLVFIFFVCVVALPARALAQASPESSSETDAPVLTLENAISLAMSDSRLVKDAVLDAEKHDFRINVARSRRLPQFQFSVLAGELLHAVESTFPAGAFGTYPSTGPIPATEAKVRTPAQFTTIVNGSIDLPLLQQYKIGLGIRATEVGSDIAREGVRGQRQKIAADVRTAYFNLVASQAAVDAARQSVRTLEEARRVTAQYRVQETVLRADALEVDARLAKSRYELSVAENGLATQREHLNQLLGRDLTTPFRVHAMPEEEAIGLTLDAARQRASQNRHEIRQAGSEGDTGGIRPSPGQSRVHPGPELVAAVFRLQQFPGDTGECHVSRLLPDMGAVRLGTSPQQRGGKGQDPRTGPQRSAGNESSDRGRSRSDVPQVAGGRTAAESGTRSDRKRPSSSSA